MQSYKEYVINRFFGGMFYSNNLFIVFDKNKKSGADYICSASMELYVLFLLDVNNGETVRCNALYALT